MSKTEKRKCTGCGKTKDLNADNFHRNESRGGFHSRCKTCRTKPEEREAIVEKKRND